MITFFRKTLTSWPVLILLGFILIAFAVTGVGDPFGSKSAPQGSIAKVGGVVVTEPALLQRFERVVRQARESQPNISQTQLAREGAVPAIAEQLIGTTALEVFAKKLGLAASERAVGGEIGGIPAFQSGGKFDEATYRRVIADQRMTDRELRGGIGGDLIRKQLITPLTSALQVPRGMAEPYARLLLDVHRGEVAIVPIGEAPAPTDAEIAAYYAAHKAQFTLPERRAFRYALIDREAIAAGVKVADADIAKAFAADRDKYGGEAVRTLSQVVVPDEAKAQAIAAAAKTEGFAKAAQRLGGVAAADLALGEQTQSKFAIASTPAIAAAAFGGAAGTTTAPMKSDFGWHVVHIDSIGAGGKTLAQARPAVLADLTKAATDKAVSAVVAKIDDGAEAGRSFAEIANDAGLTIQTAAAVTRDGRTGAGPETALPAPLLPLAVKAFGHEPADGAAVEDLGGGKLAAIETVQVYSPTPQPLADVRATVVTAVAHDKALALAKRKADAVIAAVAKGTAFAAAVAAQGLPAPKPLAGRRIDAQQQNPVPPVVTAFLTTAAGKIRALPGDQGWVLIHVDAVEAGNLATAPQLVDSIRASFAKDAPDEFGAAFAAAAGKAVGVERNNAQIDAVSKRLSGQGDTGGQ